MEESTKEETVTIPEADSVKAQGRKIRKADQFAFQNILTLLQRNPNDRALRVDRSILESAIVLHLKLGQAYDKLREEMKEMEATADDLLTQKGLDNAEDSELDPRSVSDPIRNGEQCNRGDSAGTAGDGAGSSPEVVEPTENRGS